MGKTCDQDQGVQSWGKLPRIHKANISTGVRLQKQENTETALTSFFQGLNSIPADPLDLAKAVRTHWIELWRNLRMDCAGRTLISTEELGRVLSKLKNGKGSPDQITADVLKALLPERSRKVRISNSEGPSYTSTTCRSPIISSLRKSSRTCGKVESRRRRTSKWYRNVEDQLIDLGTYFCQRRRKPPFILDQITLKIWNYTGKRTSRNSRICSISLRS